MPIHSATFSQPGLELNPLGVPIAAKIEVEVFQDKPGVWQAREKSTGRVFKQVGKERVVYGARYRVARLFNQQLTPWSVDGTQDPTADLYHIHSASDVPSLCGSRYHPALQIVLLPEVRAGRRLPERPNVKGAWLCPYCLSTVDRSPQIGDAVRHRLSNGSGFIVGVPDKPGATAEYFVQFVATGETRRIPGGELALTMLDWLPTL